mmetsp:Transcript_40967/g.110784  ORF Transcript_40967/g.110784 Transcript_40967/m.110784 type:complete len:252 (-) Transcript_40967:167-922(-)
MMRASVPMTVHRCCPAEATGRPCPSSALRCGNGSDVVTVRTTQPSHTTLQEDSLGSKVAYLLPPGPRIRTVSSFSAPTLLMKSGPMQACGCREVLVVVNCSHKPLPVGADFTGGACPTSSEGSSAIDPNLGSHACSSGSLLVPYTSTGNMPDRSLRMESMGILNCAAPCGSMSFGQIGGTTMGGPLKPFGDVTNTGSRCAPLSKGNSNSTSPGTGSLPSMATLHRVIMRRKVMKMLIAMMQNRGTPPIMPD